MREAKKHNFKVYWVYPTRGCNLACEYCIQSAARKDAETCEARLAMTKETADQLIRFISRDEPEKEKQVQFFGGEPMLAFDMIKYIASRLKEKIYNPLKFTMTTNGTLLDRPALEWLKENGFVIAVSVDGPPGVTRKTRPGSEKADMRLIHEYYPNAQIIMTLSPSNIADAMASTKYFIDDLGFRAVAHNTAAQEAWPAAATREHDRFYEQLADYYIEKQRAGKPAGFMFIGHGKKSVHGSRYEGPKWICGSNPGLLGIDANGDIYPCQEMVLMDVNKTWKIGDIWSGYVPQQSIPLEAMKFENREACGTCIAFNLCVGGCGPKNIFTTGDRFKPIQACCGLMQKQVQEALRALLLTGQLSIQDKQNKQDNKKGTKPCPAKI